MHATVLAFDTSTDELNAALCTAGGANVVRSEPGGARASARLLPLLLELLAEARIALDRVEAFAFGRGPGAFTGLRTACAVAQGLAYGCARPVLPIDSLMLAAEDSAAALGARPGDEVWAAMDARMDEVYAARYRLASPGRWTVADAPALYAWSALAARWSDAPPRFVAGSAVDAFAGRLPFGAAACCARGGDRAGALLRLAQAAWQDGQAVDAALALPLYLRDKVALTTEERLALKAADAASR